MTESERAILKQIYNLHLQLFDRQSEEIEALHQANRALQTSHKTIGELMVLTGQLAGFTN